MSCLMNREILFRGRTITGDWVYGLISLSKGSDGQPEKGYYISNRAGMPWAYQVRPETVGLGANKLDQDENEIFEQDIVSIYRVDCGTGEIVFEKLKFSVKYWIPEMTKPGIYGKKEIIRGHYMYLDLFDIGNKHIKRLGNRFDNPDLLKKR